MDIQEVARNFYATVDTQDWDKLASLVSPDLAVHLGSATRSASMTGANR